MFFRLLWQYDVGVGATYILLICRCNIFKYIFHVLCSNIVFNSKIEDFFIGEGSHVSTLFTITTKHPLFCTIIF